MNPSAGSDGAATRPSPRWLFGLVDFGVTIVLWVYFTLGFVVFFGPFYLLAMIMGPDRHLRFQKLNHLFYRGFIKICRLLMPRQQWRIDPRLAGVRSSVIVCNHISYMDPILLIAQYARHTTIAKNRLFGFPILGWLLRNSGYLPSASQGKLADLTSRRLAAMPAFLASGGNLIVFPEGTRSRDGTVGDFNAGAFKIARLCRAPLAVVRIRNTNRLFTPGKFLFNTCSANTHTLELLAQLTPDYGGTNFSLTDLMAQVRAILEESHESRFDLHAGRGSLGDS